MGSKKLQPFENQIFHQQIATLFSFVKSKFYN